MATSLSPLTPASSVIQSQFVREIQSGKEDMVAGIEKMELPYETELKRYVAVGDTDFNAWLDIVKDLLTNLKNITITYSTFLLNPNNYNDAYASSELTSLANNILTNLAAGGSGLSSAVEDAIYERARQRILYQSNRQTRRITTEIAARLPYAGAIADLLLEADRDVILQTNETNRDILVKQAELAYQNQRDKIKEAIALEQAKMANFEQRRDRSLRAYAKYDENTVLDHWKFFEFNMNRAIEMARIVSTELLRLIAQGADQLTFENWLAMSKLMAEGQLRIMSSLTNLLPSGSALA